ncbi:hypothetical protein AgCh_004822 [Apium graveolens]
MHKAQLKAFHLFGKAFKVKLTGHEDRIRKMKKDDQNPSGSNPSQSNKPTGRKGGEKKKEDDKKNEEKKRRGERRNKKLHDGSEPHQSLKIQTQLAKPSLKIKHKSIGRKPKKVKPTKKEEITERAIWNCFKESDFLPLNWCTSYEEYFQHLAEEIVRVSVVSMREDKDTATRAWRSVLAEWLIEREETKKRNEAEAEERRRKYDEEIEMYIKRLEELKAKGMSRISKDGKFSNIKMGGFSRSRLESFSINSVKPKNSMWKKIKKIMPQKNYEEAWS